MKRRVTRADVLPGREGSQAGAMARRRRREGRRRPWLAPLVSVLATAALATLAWWLLTSPTFRVAKVESSAYRFTSKTVVDGRLRDWLKRDLNIWTLDGDSLSRELEALPWVRRARIGRRLPATLQVDLWEWRPLLLLADGNGDDAEHGLALVQNGAALPLPAHLPPPDLPLLIDGAGAAPRDAAVCARLLDLLAAIRETGLERACDVDFIRRGGRGLSVVLAGNRGRLVVGREDFAARLRRYLDVADRVPAGAVIDLRFERQVYIDETHDDRRAASGRSG